MPKVIARPEMTFHREGPFCIRWKVFIETANGSELDTGVAMFQFLASIAAHRHLKRRSQELYIQYSSGDLRPLEMS